jgi:WD40 repeat protein
MIGKFCLGSGLAAFYLRISIWLMELKRFHLRRYDIICQDSTWRAAFFYHFCLEESLARVPGNRISSESWQAEFIARYALAQKWTKSKVSTITHDPRVGNISLIHANVALERHATSRSSTWKPRSAKDNNAHGNAPTMISVSIPRGTASRSDPFSGKVAKGGFIEGAPMPVFIAGLGGNLDTVTTAAISKDGNTIAWGMANGSLHLSRTGLGGRYIHGQGQRASPPAPVGSPLHNHFGPITAVCFIDGSDIMASAATDGIVKLWDPTAGAVWASPDVTSAGVGRPDDIEILTARFSKIASTLVLLAAGTRAGLVHFWTVDLKARTALDYRKVDPLNTGGEPSLPVEVIRIDPTRSALLVQYQLESCFYRIEWPSIDDIKVTKFAHQDGFLGSITAIHANFAEQEKKLEITGGIVSINGQDTPATPVEDSATSTSLVHRSFGGFSYIVAGDDQGRTFIWDWEEQHTAVQSVHPLRQLQGFETKVTSIEVTDLLILIGT